jgi:hypothetical protein
MQYKIDVCSGCDKKRPLINQKHKMCQECNKQRLKERGGMESVNPKSNDYQADQQFYLAAYHSSDKRCEECGKYLGEKMQRIFVSHILAKGPYPKMRHDMRNYQILCPQHHYQYEFGDRSKLSTWPETEKRKIALMNEYYEGNNII